MRLIAKNSICQHLTVSVVGETLVRLHETRGKKVSSGLTPSESDNLIDRKEIETESHRSPCPQEEGQVGASIEIFGQSLMGTALENAIRCLKRTTRSQTSADRPACTVAGREGFVRAHMVHARQIPVALANKLVPVRTADRPHRAGQVGHETGIGIEHIGPTDGPASDEIMTGTGREDDVHHRRLGLRWAV